MELFPESGTLQFLAMDIIGTLPKTDNGNHFVVLITDR